MNVPVLHADSGGWILTQLWQWRQQRQQAIDKELRRLQRQLTRLEQQTAGQSDLAGYGTSHVSKRLTDWLEQSGAQVMWLLFVFEDVIVTLLGPGAAIAPVRLQITTVQQPLAW